MRDFNEVLFLDDELVTGFCSDVCIEEYYSFLSSHFQEMDSKYRSMFGLLTEQVLEHNINSRVLEETLQNPDEIWQLKNKCKETMYSFVKEHVDEDDETYHSIVFCFVYKHSPSYVFASTVTASTDLLNLYRFGDKVENIEEYTNAQKQASQSLEVSSDTIENLELKKSQYLAELMETRIDSDIPFEAFNLYMDYYSSTLEAPDEVYKNSDEDDEDVYIYIKAHNKDDSAFYFVVLCIIGVNESTGKSTLFPVLSFPTIDPELYRHYAQGKQISGALKS